MTGSPLRRKLLTRWLRELKLRIAVGVLRPFFGLGVGLERIAHLTQASAHGDARDRVAQAVEFFGNGPRGLVGPFEQAHRVARRRLLQDSGEMWADGGGDLLRFFAPASRPADPSCVGRLQPASCLAAL